MIYKYVEFGIPGLAKDVVSTLHKHHLVGTTLKHAPSLIHGYFKGASQAKNSMINEQYNKALLKDPTLKRKDFIKTLPMDKIKSKASVDSIDSLVKDKVPGLLDDIQKQGSKASQKEIRGLSKENERLKKQIAKLQARG